MELGNRRMELIQHGSREAAAEQIAKDTAHALCLARCLIDSAVADYKHCIRPLPLLCAW